MPPANGPIARIQLQEMPTSGRTKRAKPLSRALGATQPLDEESAIKDSQSATKPERVSYKDTGLLDKVDILSTNRIPTTDEEEQDLVVLAWDNHEVDINSTTSSVHLRWIHLEKTCLKFQEFRDLIEHASLDPRRKEIARRCLQDVQRLHERRFWRGKYLEPVAFQHRPVSAKKDRGHPTTSATFVNLPLFALYDSQVNGEFKGNRESSENPVRSLLQYFYRLDTTERRDQRQTVNILPSRHIGTGKVVQVPHLWGLIVDKDTLITCAPLSFDHLRGVIEDERSSTTANSKLHLTPYTHMDPHVKYTNLEGKEFFFPLKDCKSWLGLLDKLSNLAVHPVLTFLALTQTFSPYVLIGDDASELDQQAWAERVSKWRQDLQNSQRPKSKIFTVKLVERSLGDWDTDSSSFDDREVRSVRPSKWDFIRERIKATRLQKQVLDALVDSNDQIGPVDHSRGKQDNPRPGAGTSADRLATAQSPKDIEKLLTIASSASISKEQDATKQGYMASTRKRIPSTGNKRQEPVTPESSPVLRMKSSSPSLHDYRDVDTGDYNRSQQDLLGLAATNLGSTPDQYPQSIPQGMMSSVGATDNKYIGAEERPAIQPLFMAHSPSFNESTLRKPKAYSQGSGHQHSGSDHSGSMTPRPARRREQGNRPFKSRKGPQHHRRLSESPAPLPSDVDDGVRAQWLPSVSRDSGTSPSMKRKVQTIVPRRSASSRSPRRQKESNRTGQQKLLEASRRLNSLEYTTSRPFYSWPVGLGKEAQESILKVHDHILSEGMGDYGDLQPDDYQDIDGCSRSKVEYLAAGCAIDADSRPNAEAKILRTKADVYIIARHLLYCFVEEGTESVAIQKYWGVIYKICNLDLGEITKSKGTYANSSEHRHENFIEHIRNLTNAFYKSLSRDILRMVESEITDPFPYEVPLPLLHAFWQLIAFYVIALKCRSFDKIEKAGQLILKSVKNAHFQLFHPHSEAEILHKRAGDEALTSEALFSLVVESCLQIGAPENEMLDEIRYKPEVFDIVEIYSRYVSHLLLQARDHARLRVYEQIKLAEEEVVIISRVLKSQLRVVKKFKELTSKDVSLLEARSKRRVVSKIHEMIDEFSELQDNLDAARYWATQAIQVKTEANNTAILVFTTVTIIFLPLSFVAGYFGMNTVTGASTSEEEFWSIAIPVTVAILIVALIVAYYSSWMPALRRKFSRSD